MLQGAGGDPTFHGVSVGWFVLGKRGNWTPAVGLKATQFFAGGDTGFQVYLGLLDHKNIFGGLMLVGSHSQNISKSIIFDLQATLGGSNGGLGVAMGCSFGYHIEAETPQVQMTLGIAYSN